MSNLQEKDVLVTNDDNATDETMQVWKLTEARKFYSFRNIGETEAAIKKYKGTEKNVVIPYMVGNRKVVEIDDEAFKENQDVEKVVFPAGIRRILDDAFSGCKNLKEVIFNNGLQSIQRRSFEYCNSLTDVILPKTVTTIDVAAFSETAITKIEIPCGIKNIGSGAFMGCQI